MFEWNFSHSQIILDLFINQELISFKGTIVAKYEKLLRRGTSTVPDTGIFDKTPEGEKRWSDLHLRVGEHVSIFILKLSLISPFSEHAHDRQVLYPNHIRASC